MSGTESNVSFFGHRFEIAQLQRNGKQYKFPSFCKRVAQAELTREERNAVQWNPAITKYHGTEKKNNNY